VSQSAWLGDVVPGGLVIDDTALPKKRAALVGVVAHSASYRSRKTSNCQSLVSRRTGFAREVRR
jgi:hypothetical protein